MTKTPLTAGFQTQVFPGPRSGRTPGKWIVQAYKADQIASFWEAEIQDFEVVIAKIKNFVGPQVVVRIIGPDDATREQLDQLRALGATPTWP
jgi:hypothetical protein